MLIVSFKELGVDWLLTSKFYITNYRHHVSLNSLCQITASIVKQTVI